MTQIQQRKLHAKRHWRRIPVWQHVCQDCGTPILAAGICAACADIREEVSEITFVQPVLAEPANVITHPACLISEIETLLNPEDL